MKQKGFCKVVVDAKPRQVGAAQKCQPELTSTSHWQQGLHNQIQEAVIVITRSQGGGSRGQIGQKMAQKAGQIYFKIRTNIFRTSLRMWPGSEEEVYELQRTMHHLHCTSFYDCAAYIQILFESKTMKIQFSKKLQIYFENHANMFQNQCTHSTSFMGLIYSLHFELYFGKQL